MCFSFQVLVFSESLVPTVRKALCDPLEEVREAAAKTFEQLHATIGHQALDDILPNLLKQLVGRRNARLTTLKRCNPGFNVLFFWCSFVRMTRRQPGLLWMA